MTGSPKGLDQLARKRFDLRLQCRRCRYDVIVPIGIAIALFQAMGWSMDWALARKRFRCSRCGRTDAVRLGGAVQSAGEGRLPSASPIVVLRPPPKGILARDWYMADERERRRLIHRARS